MSASTASVPEQLKLDLEDLTWDEWFRSLPPFPGAEPDEREEPA